MPVSLFFTVLLVFMAGMMSAELMMTVKTKKETDKITINRPPLECLNSVYREVYGSFHLENHKATRATRINKNIDFYFAGGTWDAYFAREKITDDIGETTSLLLTEFAECFRQTELAWEVNIEVRHKSANNAEYPYLSFFGKNDEYSGSFAVDAPALELIDIHGHGFLEARRAALGQASAVHIDEDPFSSGLSSFCAMNTDCTSGFDSSSVVHVTGSLNGFIDSSKIISIKDTENFLIRLADNKYYQLTKVARDDPCMALLGTSASLIGIRKIMASGPATTSEFPFGNEILTTVANCLLPVKPHIDEYKAVASTIELSRWKQMSDIGFYTIPVKSGGKEVVVTTVGEGLIEKGIPADVVEAGHFGNFPVNLLYDNASKELYPENEWGIDGRRKLTTTMGLSRVAFAYVTPCDQCRSEKAIATMILELGRIRR